MFNYRIFFQHLFNDDKPSEYLFYLKRCNLLGYIPQLDQLNDCIHEPEWHPEGNVWVHTLMVVDVAAELKSELDSQDERAAFMMGALCHDLGKPIVTEYSEGKIKSKMHDQAGVLPAKLLLNKMDFKESIIIKTLSYISNHLIPLQLYKNKNNVSDKAIMKLEKRIHIPHLVLLTKADHWGRTDYDAQNRICEPADWLLDKYFKILK